MRWVIVSTAAALVACLGPFVASADTVHVREDAELNLRTGELVGRGQHLRVGQLWDRDREGSRHGSRLGYVRFDLSTLPPDAVVSRAVLRLFASRVHRSGRLEVFLPDQPLTELKGSHRAPPDLGTSIGSVELRAADQGRFVVVDVLAALQGWLEGSSPEQGLLLVAGDRRLGVEFDSKENVLTSHAPELEVVLQGPSGPDLGDRLALLEARVAQLESVVGVSCPVGRTRCGQACVDTATDPGHCGGCGLACASGVCLGGECVGAPDESTFVMPFQGPPAPQSIEEGATARQPKVDAYVLLDRSGSMSAEILAVKNNLSQVLAEARCPATGTPSGPCIQDLWAGAGTVGYAGGEPFRHFADIQPAPNLASLPTTEPGGCCDEALLAGLWSTAMGLGSAASGCALASYPARGTCSGSAAGAAGIGYPCYRPDALRIVLLATDEAPLDPSAGTLKCPAWATAVRPAAAAIGLRVVGVLGSGASSTTRSDLQSMARDTQAVDAAGQPLVFDGADAAAPQAIRQALLALGTASQTFSAVVVDDPADAVDVRAAFVSRVETAPLGTPECTAGLVQTDSDADGFPDTYLGVPAGTPMCWRVVARANSSVPPAAGAQTFRASLVVRFASGAEVSSLPLTFVVPGQ